uniref:Uncharacterized protein n=3 Tax=Aegilops tauschii subsp. strangulata TaxID=200361 RepID=A0A453N5M8_AEGTS
SRSPSSAVSVRPSVTHSPCVAAAAHGDVRLLPPLPPHSRDVTATLRPIPTHLPKAAPHVPRQTARRERERPWRRWSASSRCRAPTTSTWPVRARSSFFPSRLACARVVLLISGLGAALRRIGAKGVEVRKAEQLLGIDSLIIPGGESTTMAKLANFHNLFPALREFVGTGKPVWGTCAGLIFLADKAVGQKTGGQELVGGLDCTVHRNFFGSQLQSFETELSVPMLAEKEGGSNTCRGVFIRAPAILEVGQDVEVLADCPVPAGRPSITITSGEGLEDQVYSKDRVIVAVRQGNILATAFHPELTSDSRWHRVFLDMDKESQAKALAALSLSASSNDADVGSKNKAPDLPIFE